MIDLPAAARTHLYTTFGTVVYVDAASGEVRHGAIADSRANAVLVVDQSVAEGLRTASLMYDAVGVLQPIIFSADGCWRASNTKKTETSATPRPLRVVRLDRGLIALQSGGLYLCAEADGRITLSRTECSLWECFVPSKDWCAAPSSTDPAQSEDIDNATINWPAIRVFRAGAGMAISGMPAPDDPRSKADSSVETPGSTYLTPARAPGLPPFGLPAQYIERSDPVHFDDTAYAETEIIHQPEVYAAADYFVAATGRTTVIDIGCGNGRKLQNIAATRRIGVDVGSTISWCKAHYSTVSEWVEADLSQPACLRLAELASDQAVVVCADVIEHLVDPRPLVDLLSACYRRGAIILTSTPDRSRVWGENHLGPPPNPAHVREWALDEYVAFLAGAGLPAVYAGYTLSDNVKRELKTIITLHDFAIDRARAAIGGRRVRPVAILAAYNEGDVIKEVTEDFLAQGCDIVAIDNWSTDNTWETLEALAAQYPASIRVERFPSAGPAAYYDWQAILRRKQDLAAEYQGRWIIHTDADEIRRSPFPDLTLAEALAVTEAVGANRVDFNLLHFRPVDERPYHPGSLAQHFASFEYGSGSPDFYQKKAWLQGPEKVDLAFHGGHEACFEGACDFPYKFHLRHYPIRSQEHGRRKVLQDRQPRWSPVERTFGWHTQYDAYSGGSANFIWSRDTLQKLDADFWQEHGLLLLTDLAHRRITGA